MIDIHAHLCFPEYDRDREEVIDKCKKELAGVIVSSARYREGLQVLDIVDKYKGFLFATLGYHPTEGTEFERTIKLIKANSERIVGVGEVGMDYHWEKDTEKRREQKEKFAKFIELARKLSKPLVIHSWDAERECFEMVKDSPTNIIFHCFSGNRELAKEIVSRGFYISISTMILFSKNIRKIAKDMPLDRFLLETDSPFLSPDKAKDPRNYPWNIKLSAEKIAEIKGTSKEEILENAKMNAIRAFNLKSANHNFYVKT